jgi:hypothetical protein
MLFLELAELAALVLQAQYLEFQLLMQAEEGQAHNRHILLEQVDPILAVMGQEIQLMLLLDQPILVLVAVVVLQPAADLEYLHLVVQA